MSLEAAGPLQNQINGSHFGDHHVEIQVKALLNHLGGYQHRPVGPLHLPEIPFLSLRLATWLAESQEGAQLPLFPTFKEIPGVKQIELRPAVTCLYPREMRFEGCVNFLGSTNGIADDRCAASFCQ